MTLLTCLGAGGGQEVGEDAGDRPQPAQAGAEDEVCLDFVFIIDWLIKSGR